MLLLKSLYANRSVVWSLIKNDIRSRYLGSYLGSLWVFLLPIVNLFIMWFAFEYGIKSERNHGFPFILWLVTGTFPWAFFSDSVLSSSGAIVEKSFLVKKILFDVELLPLIKIAASGILFVFLSLVMIAMMLIYGNFPSVYWIQIPYYILCICLLVFSISLISSSIIVFYRDLSQILSLFIQLGFWITPIFWAPERLPDRFKFIVFLNPVNYVISGYRDTFFFKKWFWENPYETTFFWFLILLLIFIGRNIFRKLRPHFADVL